MLKNEITYNGHERDNEWIPKEFNICYEDIDGRWMVQESVLNSNMGTKFYQLDKDSWEA